MDNTKAQKVIEVQAEILFSALKDSVDMKEAFVSGLVIAVSIQNVSDGQIDTIDLAGGNIHSCVYALDVAHEHLMRKVG